MQQYGLSVDVTVFGSDGSLADARNLNTSALPGYQASTLRVKGQGNTIGGALRTFSQSMAHLVQELDGTGYFPVLMGTYLKGETPACHSPLHELLSRAYGDTMAQYRPLLLNTTFTLPLHPDKAIAQRQLDAGIAMVPLLTAFMGSSPAGQFHSARSEYANSINPGAFISRYHVIANPDGYKGSLRQEHSSFIQGMRKHLKEMRKHDIAHAELLEAVLAQLKPSTLVQGPWTITTSSDRDHKDNDALVLQADSCPDLETTLGMMAMASGALRAAERSALPISSKRMASLKGMEHRARWAGLSDQHGNEMLRVHAAMMLDVTSSHLAQYERTLLEPLKTRFSAQRTPADDMRTMVAEGGYQAISENIVIPSAAAVLGTTAGVAAQIPPPLPAYEPAPARLSLASAVEAVASLAGIVLFR